MDFQRSASDCKSAYHIKLAVMRRACGRSLGRVSFLPPLFPFSVVCSSYDKVGCYCRHLTSQPATTRSVHDSPFVRVVGGTAVVGVAESVQSFSVSLEVPA